MKIALCLEYPIAQAGGVSVLVFTLVRELAATHQVFLVSPDDRVALENSEINGLICGHLLWEPQKASAETSRRLADQLAGAQVELAHFHFGGNFGWSNRWPSRCPIPLVAQRGIPVVSTIHMAVGLLHGYCGPQKPLLFKLVLLPLAWINKMRVLRWVEREITVSRQDLRHLRHWYWPVRNKFRTIYHSRISAGVEKDAFSKARQNLILSVGHVARRKGQVVLAEAFLMIADRYPDWRLQFVGHVAETETGNALTKCAAKLTPGRIELLGQRSDTADLMRRAAIYVQPSFHEGLPLSLQEALWHGCACIATNIPGNTELVESERSGLLVTAGDVASLAQAMERLIKDDKLRQRFSAMGQGTVERLEMTRLLMTNNHLKLYGEIIAKS